LAVGPDHSLWFTELRAFAIARLDSGGRIQEYNLPKYVVPTELAFVNTTLGYYTDPGIAGFGSVFSFNPSNFTSQRIGGAIVLFGPDSVAAGDGGIWLAEHGGSDVRFYDITKSAWTIYPTSNSQVTDLTLPFYVRVNDTKVWFNEQFADRMGVIDAAENSMTEYPFSRPAASNFTQIGDVQTIVLSGSRVWFTESAHNSVGYLDSSYQPTFSVAVGDSSVTLGKGARANVTLSIVDHSSKPLSLQFADTERRIGRNQNITLVTRAGFIPSSDVSQHIALTIGLVGNLAPGKYLVAITVTDGVIYRSTFITVNVLS
jgi:streptogramin lyase